MDDEAVRTTRNGYARKPPIGNLMRSVLHDGPHTTWEFERAAIRAGHHPSSATTELRHMIERGELRRIGRGVYERGAVQ